jgi:hypothetical protein
MAVLTSDIEILLRHGERVYLVTSTFMMNVKCEWSRPKYILVTRVADEHHFDVRLLLGGDRLLCPAEDCRELTSAELLAVNQGIVTV